jgi:predicted nuclease of predicted toxin-antitoxin system
VLFLADESCDFAVVRALRDGGHDVLAVAEVARGAKDPEVVRLARDEGRVLLTEDKDFGWYVYAAGERGVGVVLIRFPSGSRRVLGSAVLEAVRSADDRLLRSFTVIEPGRVRVSATPTHGPRP